MKRNSLSKEHSGEWILLFNDEIVDHSSNVEEILRLAEQRFPEEKFPEDNIRITKVLSGENRLL
jgi:hypothetical protein